LKVKYYVQICDGCVFYGDKLVKKKGRKEIKLTENKLCDLFILTDEHNNIIKIPANLIARYFTVYMNRGEQNI